MSNGSCHCGQVAFEVQGQPSQVIECNCSHCQRKGFLLWFVPREQLCITQGEDAMATYHFNKHVIDHMFCPTCGVQPFGFGQDPKTGAAIAAINVRCLEGIELGAVERLPYDGRSLS